MARPTLSIVLNVLTALTLCSATYAQAIVKPQVLDDRLQIELVLSEPDIVTPIGCRVDDAGRLYVVESHTHQRPDDYEGPAGDRIRIVDDSDADGHLDRVRTFYQAGEATMGLTLGPENWVYVASRSELYRVRDKNGDGKANERQQILNLETSADYPHNGLGQLCFGPDRLLYVGMGENFGHEYRLVAADGSVQTGSGEGGNIFRCTATGESLQRVATGFWNPFGIAFDPAGRLWTVDNDPDASPPCRILHVVQTGDYGFQFRFGRGGTNPLQSWDGELPGCLPMAGGTGEAPSAILPYHGQLWVTSWGDNRIEAHALERSGASWETQMVTVIQGGADFRPVDLALAPDGSLYVTDWVDRSYPVHGRGRIWRIRWVEPPLETVPWPELSAAEKIAQHFVDSPETATERQFAVSQPDPFLRQAAIAGATKQNVMLDFQSPRPPTRLAALIQAHWLHLSDSGSEPSETDKYLSAGLADESDRVVQYALRWTAAEGRSVQLPAVEALLDSDRISATTTKLALATIAHLKHGASSQAQQQQEFVQLLSSIALDASRPERVRSVAINAVPDQSDEPASPQLASLVDTSKSDELARAALRLLTMRQGATDQKQLLALAQNQQLDPQLRADALAGLVDVSSHLEAIRQLASETGPVASEAERVLAAAGNSTATADLPPETDLDAWLQLVSAPGDARAGERVFQRSQCSRCHAYRGRGSNVGPDLTNIGARFDRRRLLESILLPSKEIAPMYVPWVVLTVDGQVHTGLKAVSGGVATETKYIAADGTAFSIPLAEIETQRAADVSIMPAGLQKTMSLDELRDLLAFLARSEDG